MDIEFHNEQELYDRLKSVLNIRARDLDTHEHIKIKEEEIWNFLRNTKWINSTELGLSNMVDDILKFKSNELLKYLSENNKTRG